MAIQFNKCVLEMLILSLVNNNTYTSFQIENMINTNIKTPEGSTYPILRKLVNDGYISTNNHINENGKTIKYYALTKNGLDYYIQLDTEWSNLIGRINLVMKEE